MTSSYLIPQKKTFSLLILTLLVFGSLFAEAQDKSKTPDPKEILAAAVQATQKMKSVSYEAQFEAVYLGPKSVSTKGAVEAERGGSSNQVLPGRIRIKTEGYGGAQEVTYDGKIARRLSHDKKLLTEGTVEKGGLGVAVNSSGMTLLLWDLTWAEPLKFENAATSMEYLGLASVEGVICHVIDLQYTIPGTDIREARWWFSVEDKLPRRYQKISHSPSGKLTMELTISNLRMGNGIAPSAYAIELPKGYSFQRFVPGPSPQPIPVGTDAPDWVLRNDSGKEHKLSDYKGKVTVLMFWATWCGYCRLAIPGIQQIYEKYKGRDVQVLSINMQESEDVDPVAYLKTVNADFPVLMKGEKTADSYNIRGVPGFYVIDQSGKVVYGKLMFNTTVMREIEVAVEAALTKPKV